MPNDIYFGSGQHRLKRTTEPPSVPERRTEERQPAQPRETRSAAKNGSPVYYGGTGNSAVTADTARTAGKNREPVYYSGKSTAAVNAGRRASQQTAPVNAARSPVTRDVPAFSAKNTAAEKTAAERGPVVYRREPTASAEVRTERNPTAYRGSDISFGMGTVPPERSEAAPRPQQETSAAPVPVSYPSRSTPSAARRSSSYTPAAYSPAPAPTAQNAFSPAPKVLSDPTDTGTVPAPSAGSRPERRPVQSREPVRYQRPPVRTETPAAKPKKHLPVTERIEDDLLHKAPTPTPYNYIDFEDDFGASASYRTEFHELTDEEREQRRRQRMKEAKKYLRKEARKKSRLPRLIKTAVSVVLALVLLLLGTCAFAVTGYTPQPLAENTYIGDDALMQSSSVYNLLLMGIDMQNTSDTSRSDSMILLSIDKKHSKLKITSFMRDTFTDIPGYGGAKLNAACTYGGPQLVCDTIETTFKIKIDGYIKIGYEVLTGLIDGLGGIDIPEVDEIEAAALADEGYDAPVGTDVHMNGFETLQYCRIRHGQDDFHRTARQREVIGVVTQKLKRANPVRLAFLARKLLGMTECSISHAGMFSVLLRAFLCLSGGTEQGRIPTDGSWYDDYRNGQAVLIADTDANVEYLNEFIYGKGEETA